MLRECLVGFRGCDRYTAHAKIDSSLRQFPREGQRSWHSSVVQAGEDVFSGSIRTRSDEVVAALPQAKWREVALSGVGDVCEAYVEVTPKKPAQFSAFRESDFALEFARKRILEAEAFESLEAEFVAHGMVDVRKPSCAYRAPSAWIRIKGTVKNAANLEKLVMQGIGGSHSFGVGLLNPQGSALFEMAKAVAEARS